MAALRATRLQETLKKGLDLLAEGNHACALVGGLAVSARTTPRFTADVDLAVAVASDREAEAVANRFQSAGATIQAMVEQDAVERLATVRLSMATREGPVLDLLFASCGIEPEVVEAAESVELLPSLRVPIATTAHLIAMKVLSAEAARPRDHSDLLALLREATTEDLAEARRALTLITKRGYHRGKTLHKELDRFIALL